jgi:hypothetical protein
MTTATHLRVAVFEYSTLYISECILYLIVFQFIIFAI